MNHEQAAVVVILGFCVGFLLVMLAIDYFAMKFGFHKWRL